MVAEHPILSTFASLIPLTVDNAPVISAMSGRAIANIVECGTRATRSPKSMGQH